MILEIITIVLSALMIFVVYAARIKSTEDKSVLFSEKFLHKADDKIFEFVKFVFKLYSLLTHNISTFIVHVPHKIIHGIHVVSHAIAQKSNKWVEKIKHTHKK